MENINKSQTLCIRNVKFSDVDANLANPYMELKDYESAIIHYEIRIEKSPYDKDAKLEDVDAFLNAKGAYVQSCVTSLLFI